MKKQTFLLPEPVIIPSLPNNTDTASITYYSDCVFNPFVHKFQPQECTITQGPKLTLDFSFILLALQSFPKILDNIGVLKIGPTRLGVLITKQKQGVFLSLID